MTTNNNNLKSKKSTSQLSLSSAQQLAPSPSSPSQPQRHDKNINNLHDFLTSLLVSPNPPSAQDTADLEELVLLMKKHTLFDPTHIPQLQDIKRLAAELPCRIPTSTKPNVTNTTTISGSINNNSNNSSDNNNNNKSSSSNSGSSNKETTTSYTTPLILNVAPVPNFEFSFSSDRQVNFPPPPEKPLYTTDRPTYRRGDVYTDEYDEVEDVKLEDQVDPEELEAIIQQRKILPLPKSRWNQKTFMATVIDEEDKSNKEQTATNKSHQGLSLGVASSLSSSSKPTTSIVGQQQGRIARRPSRGPTNLLPVSSSSLSSTAIKMTSSSLPLSPLSEETRRLTSAVKNKQSLKSDKNNVNFGFDKKESKLVFDNNLDDPSNDLKKEMGVKSIVVPGEQQQQQKSTSFRSETAIRSKKGKSKIKKKSSSVTKPADNHINEDNENNKRSTKLSTTTKGKKSQHQLEQQQPFSSRKDWLDVDLNSSDVSVIKNKNPDEWICLFCQYEIFCSGLDAAIRKRGGHRRRRRLLRAKDINDSILQHHHKYASQLNVEEEEEDPSSPLVRMSVNSRIRVVAGNHKDLVFNDYNNNNENIV